MATKRIKDLSGTATSPAVDDYLALDGTSNGTRKITRDNLISSFGATYLEESNNLSDVDSAATSRTNLDVMATGDVNDRSNSKGPINGLNFDGAGDPKIATGNTALMHAGDGTNGLALSGAAMLRANDYTSCAIFGRETGSSLQEWVLNFDSADKLAFTIFDESAASQIAVTQDTASVVDGESVHVAFTYDGTSGSSAGGGVTLYINGAAVAATAVEDGTFVAAESLTQPLEVGLNSKSGMDMAGDIHSVLIFNRELSAAEVSRLAVAGVLGPADQWGKAAGYTSDFSSGVDGWTFDNGTSPSGDTSKTLGGDSDNVAFVAGSGSTGMPRMWKAGTGFPAGVKNKRWRISGEYWLPAGQSEVQGFRVGLNTNTPADHFEYKLGLTTDAWTYFEAEILQTDTSNSTVYFMLRSTTSNNITSAAAGEFVGFRNLKVQQIGAVVALLPTQGSIEASGKWLDSSSNQLNGAASDSPAPLITEPQSSGTWTPTISFSGASVGVTYNTQEGYWKKLAEGAYLFHCRCYINSNGSSTGDLRLEGFPYTFRNSSVTTQSFFIRRYIGDSSLTVAGTSGTAMNNATYVEVKEETSHSNQNLTQATFPDGSLLQFVAVLDCEN